MRPGKRPKLALFAAGTIVLVVIAIVVFARLSWWGDRDHYQVRFPRSVTGLSPGARVELWGVPIGTVDSISLSREPGASLVVVDIAVEAGTRIPIGAKASLEIEGITWIKYIDLVGGDPGGPSLRPGADIEASERGLTAVIDQAREVVAQVERVVGKVDRTADNLLKITGDQNQKRIASVLENADRATSSFAHAGDEVRVLASDLRTRSRKLFTSLDAAGDDLSKAARTARTAMAETHRAARELRGAAGDIAALARGTGRQLQSLFSRLRSAVTSLQSLIRSLEQNPSRLLRGGPQPERGIP